MKLLWTKPSLPLSLSRPMDLSLFGIQGCGKGTHAKMLAAEFDYDIFGTGAELRKMADTDTDTGRIVKELIDGGNLAPVDIVMRVTDEWLTAHAGRKIIFDGIPRSMEQLAKFNEVVARSGRTLTGVHIVLDEEAAFQRIQKRGAGRIDDATEESIRRRLHVFKETTVPVIDWYREHHGMIDVDGDGTVEEVYARIKQALAF